jgi:foldase protein PrsA
VKIAKECGRRTVGCLLSLGVVALLATEPAQAQQKRSLFGGSKAAAAKPQESAPPAAEKAQSVHLDQINVPGVKLTAVPVNPTDPIAIINEQVITRQQLADECVARRGKEILETLINRTLIEQALKANKLEVTAAELNQEIENVARRFGIGREAWLRTLDKERGISPVQYARDIIYPALALRKLCAGRVSVTDKDLQDAFESQYGDKIRCRMIMVDKLSAAQEIWEQLRKNPGGFEKIAQERSIDAGSRSLGGQLAEPITRHAYPQTVSDAAFRQLVDGDPEDKDPTHKPKNGDFTGPIQAADSVWVILRREAIIPATPGISLKNEIVKKQTYEMIYEVKLKETMGVVFQELVKASAIENKLTGSVKLANEEQTDDFNSVDKQKVKLMKTPGGEERNVDESAVRTSGSPVAPGAGKTKLPTPAAAPAEVIQQYESLKKRPLKTGGQAGAAPAAAGAPAAASAPAPAGGGAPAGGSDH